jgi:hypothetical protein
MLIGNKMEVQFMKKLINSKLKYKSSEEIVDFCK